MYRKLEPLKGQCLRAGRPHFYTLGRASTVGLAWGGMLFIESPEAATCDQITHGVCACFLWHKARTYPRGARLGAFREYLVEVLGRVLTSGIAKDDLPRKRMADL